MKEKMFLFPGFGENERCFRNLKPFLRQYELIDIDYRPSLRKLSLTQVSPIVLVKRLIKTYNIQPNDKLVGHSMGGYFSYVISCLQGNPCCLIGSFSDTNKIVRISQSKLFNVVATGSGFIKTPLFRKYIVGKNKNTPFLNEMLSIHRNFSTFTNMDMAKMSILSFGEDLPPSTIPPFYIHAKDDTVVRTPDEFYHKVRGGHFCLVFHPDEVAEKMEIWLASLK